MTPVNVASISTAPPPTPVTRPVGLTVATDSFVDRHVACDVTVDVVLSERIATAVNCDDDPIAGGVPTTFTVMTVGPDDEDVGADDDDEGAAGVVDDEQAHAASNARLDSVRPTRVT